LRRGYDIDIGVTKQDPSARLGQKDPSNGTKKRMFALFQVEGKGTAQKIETDLQVYVKRLKYEAVVVGATGDDDGGSHSGSVYVFRTSDGGATYGQVAKLTASDAAADDDFGYSVAINGDTVVV